MTQFSSPGIQKHYVGADFRGTPGLMVPSTGSVNGKAVPYEELSAAVTALETAYEQADASDTAAWTAAYSNLSSQLAALSSGVSSNIAVAAKFNGSEAELTAALSASGNNFVLTQGSAVTTIEPSTLTSAKTDFYKNGILLTPASGAAKLYFVNASGALVQATQFNDDLRADALIYVDQGENDNSFWQIPDAPTVVGEIEGLMPFGRVQDLQVASASFLSLTANTLNTNLNGDYFTVANGSLTLSTAFLSRVTAVETSVSDEVARATAAETALQTAITDEATARTDADTAINTAITDAQATIASHSTQIGVLNNDINWAASVDQVVQTISDFYAACHPVKVLTGGIFDATGAVPTTTFYVPLNDTLDWSMPRLSESAAPYQALSRPDESYVTTYTDARSATQSGYFLKLVFSYPTQVPDGTIKAYLLRHVDAVATTPTLTGKDIPTLVSPPSGS